MEINAKKTKIMVFRKSGKLRKTVWKLGEKELEVVKNFRYLGFRFTSGNSMEKQAEELAGKAVKAANSIWGLVKRTRRNRLKNRLYLMNSLIKLMLMYGVEVWGWFAPKKIESAYAKLAKMTIGVRRNTPGYIWRKEMRLKSCSYETKERAVRYIKDIIKMREGRWPKVCLKEEMRGILNKNYSSWGKKVEEVLKEMGCEEVVRLIYGNKEIEEINGRLEEGLRKLGRREGEEDLKAVTKSSYNLVYKDILLDENEEYYWTTEKGGSNCKEIWARVRCGNVGRAQKKGEKDWTCRGCKRELETLVHILECKEIRERTGSGDKQFIKTWDEMENEGDKYEYLCNMLKGDLNEDMCEMLIKVENVLIEAGKKQEIRSGDPRVQTTKN